MIEPKELLIASEEADAIAHRMLDAGGDEIKALVMGLIGARFLAMAADVMARGRDETRAMVAAYLLSVGLAERRTCERPDCESCRGKAEAKGAEVLGLKST